MLQYYAGGTCVLDSCTFFGSGGSYSAKWETNGCGCTVTSTHEVDKGFPTTITLTSGNNQSHAVSGALTLPFTVTVMDGSSAKVQNQEVDWAITSALGGSLSTTIGNTNSSGVATSTLTLGSTSGTYTVTATSAVAPLSGSPVTFTATAGQTAIKLAFNQQPTNALSNALISPPITIWIEDASSNVVPGDNETQVTLAIGTNPGSGTLSGKKTITARGGIATFSDLSIDKAGTGYTLGVTATGLTGATSTAFNVTAGAPPPTLSCIIPSAATKGSDFNVEIGVGDSSGTANIFGMGFDLLYSNASYFNFVSADVSGSFLGGDLIYLITPDGANGKVSAGLSRKAPLSGVSGGGIVIRFKFHVALTAPDSGKVTFSFGNVSANDQNGTSIALSPISATTTIQGLTVWPGDADNNGLVNQADILPLGLYWGYAGSARSNASLQWIAQSVTPWAAQAATYADANGDGVVNQADVLPIGLNWGKARSLGKSGSSIANGQVSTQATVLGTPILQAIAPASVQGKTTFDVNIVLGDTINPVSSLFGISFVLDFAGSKNIIQVIEITPGTFLGSDIIFFPQIDNTNGSVALGITRKSGASAVAGFGQVAKIKFQVVNNTSTSSFTFATRDISANDASGNTVAIQPSSSSLLVSAKDFNSLPTEFYLGQNYPNPFNPSTIISYSLPKTAFVSLRIFNTLGQEVAILANEQKEAGYYQATWTANVPSGIYFYRLQAGEYVETKKMILLK
jgi:hypothetical protein